MSSAGKPPALLIVHVPGFDYPFVNSLIETGRFPALTSIIESGSAGHLSLPPPPVTPAVALSVATGLDPDHHGVLGHALPFMEEETIRPVSSADVKVEPVWQLAARSGVQAAAIGWPATDPASPGQACVVSNGFAEATGDEFDAWPVDESTLSDPSLADALAELRLHPSEVDAEMLLPFIPQAAKIDQETDPRLTYLAVELARAVTIHSAATWVLDHRKPEFTSVHFDLVERLSAAFMQYRDPRMPHVTETDHGIFRNVVNGAYLFFDSFLAQYLTMMGPEDRIMLVSPYGWQREGKRTPPKQHGLTLHPEPGELGMIAVKGAAVSKDALVFGADVRDVAPTALAMLGLDPPSTLPGRVLDVFDNPVDPLRPTATEAPVVEKDRPSTEVDQRRLEELIYLGLVPNPGQVPAVAAEQLAASQKVTMAKIRLRRGDTDGAMSDCREALVLRPDETTARLLLATIALRIGDGETCRSELDDLAQSGIDTVDTDILQGALATLEGEPDRAGDWLTKAVSRAEVLPSGQAAGLLSRIGNEYLKVKDSNGALSAFQQALSKDPASTQAFSGMGTALALQENHKEAIGYFERSLGGLRQQPLVWHNLAMCRLVCGDRNGAIQAFETALGIAPNLTVSKKALERLSQAVMNEAVQKIEISEPE